MRPLAVRGEAIIALGFGFVHGLAFAGILSDLGLSGTTSLLALLAFNVGIELAQLACVALVFPSLYLLSRTPLHPAFRVAGATFALAAATGWGLERLGVLPNPLGGLEDAAMGNLWVIVLALASLPLAARAFEQRFEPAAAEAPLTDPPGTPSRASAAPARARPR